MTREQKRRLRVWVIQWKASKTEDWYSLEVFRLRKSAELAVKKYRAMRPDMKFRAVSYVPEVIDEP